MRGTGRGRPARSKASFSRHILPCVFHTAMVLDTWLGKEGITWLAERDIDTLIGRSATSGGDMARMETAPRTSRSRRCAGHQGRRAGRPEEHYQGRRTAGIHQPMVSPVRASDLCRRPVMAKAVRKVRAVLPSTRRGSAMLFARACHGGACRAARFPRSPSAILIGRQPTTDPVG